MVLFDKCRHDYTCWIVVWFMLYATGLWLLPASAQAPLPAPATPTTSPASDVVRLDERLGYAVPFEYDPPKHPFAVIQVSINKSKPLPFIFDTGTQSSLFLFPWAADTLHLPLDKTMPPKSDRGASRQLTADLVNVDIPTILAGNVTYMTKAWVGPGAVLENYTTPRIAGIIGQGIFDKLTVRFDFENKLVTFFAVQHPPLRLPAPATTLRMEKPLSGYLRAYATLPGGKPMPFMLDTGNTTSILPALGSLKDTRLADGRNTSDDVSGHHTVNQVLSPRLELEGLSHPLVEFSIDPPIGQAVLGMNVLSCYCVTIDARNGFLTLEPRRNAVSKLFGTTDILLEEHQQQFFISQITREHAPSQLAPGDQLLSIDGNEVKGLTLVETYLLMNAYAGTRATLVVEDVNHTKKTISWVRRSSFPTVVTGAYGLTLLQKNGQRSRIIGIAPGSAAERAGLKVEDEVVAVNGRAAKEMTANELQELLTTDMNHHAALENILVKRKGEEKAHEFKLN